jgi:RecB family exonuclease
MLEKWHTWWTGAQAEGWRIWTTPTGVPAVELGVNAVLGGKMFKGYIDAIMVDPDDDIVVIDWKTGREPVAPMQLGFYACAIEKTIGVRPSHGSHYLARNGDLGHVYDLSIYTENVVGGWLRKAAAIEARGDFIPHPSTLCSACSVREFCLVMGGERAAEAPAF